MLGTKTSTEAESKNSVSGLLEVKVKGGTATFFLSGNEYSIYGGKQHHTMLVVKIIYHIHLDSTPISQGTISQMGS